MASRSTPPNSGRRQSGTRRRARPSYEGGFIWKARKPLYALVVLAAAAVAGFLYHVSEEPLPEAHALAQTTFIYDAHGKELASYSAENRVDISLSQVPKITVDAVVSTEDRNFFTEGAIDPLSIVRALVSNASGNSLQGASTITQQYVKQTYLDSERTLSRKIKEASIAMRVSRDMSKDQVLQGYFNTIYWGRGAYGIQAAAQTYFGVDANQLNLQESALLAGMIREPDSADPSADPTLAKQNQEESLQAMVRDHQISQQQADSAAAVPFSKYVIPRSSAKSESSQLAPNGEDYFIEAVRQELVSAYGATKVNSGGLRVTTTLDPTLQKDAYAAVYGGDPNSLDPAKGDPSGALVSLNDEGYVKALVGGQNYSTSTVNLALGATGGGGGRQPGSTFKGIMLADLIKLGYSPDSVLPAPPKLTIPHGNANGKAWAITNFAGEAIAPKMSIVDATADSVNTVYAQIVAEIGATSLDKMAKEMGIKPSELGHNLSEVLGTDEVSPLEMAAAYATLAAGGEYHTPILITKVTTSTGKVLPLPVKPASRRVLSADQAAEETWILQQVVLRGTGVAAGDVGSEVAGKTGTTDNSANAWFIGYTPKITTAMWMGYASGFKPMNHFRGLKSVQGGDTPAQIWHDYMTAALAAEPKFDGDFPTISGLSGKTLPQPAAGTVVYPTTTTTAPPTTTTTTVPGATTTTTAPGATTTTTAPKKPTTAPKKH